MASDVFSPLGLNESKNKQQIIRDLSFGFENVIHNIDTTNIDIQFLRKEVSKIK